MYVLYEIHTHTWGCCLGQGREERNSFSDEEVYEEVKNGPPTIESTIFAALNKIGIVVTCLLTIWNIFSLRILNLLDFIWHQKFINGYIMFLVDQQFIIVATTRKHFVISRLSFATSI